MKNPDNRLFALAVVFASLTACDGTFGLSDGGRQLGVISFYYDPIVVEVPDTVQRGQPFAIRVRTYGGGCVSQGPTEFEVRDLDAEVTPYDDYSGASVCTDILRLFSHGATLRFDRVGTATIKVRGARKPENRRLDVVRTVTVK
jgi:hypothetical protein